MPDQSAIAVPRRADYFSYAEKDAFIVPLVREHIESALAKYAAPAPLNARALDVGCGGQPFRRNLESLGYTYTGLDREQNMSSTVDLLHSINETISKDAFVVPPFQFVLCTEVLEHVADWSKAFANLSLFTAPGGRVLITCPYVFYLHDEPYDFWRPTLYVLKHFASLSGFRVLEATGAGDGWNVLGTLLASCQLAPSNNRFLTRATCKLIRGFRKLLLWLLIRQWLQKNIRIEGSWYQSNVVVLEKL